jgi:hypothetical protein
MKSQSLLFALSVVACCGCWWQKPHMMTAAIAFDTLPASSRSLLLRGLSTLRPLFPLHFQSEQTAAVWPDHLKAVGFSLLNNLHFIDIPFVSEGFNKTIPPRVDAADDIVFALKQAVKTLKDKKNDPFTRAFMFAYLMHLTGDLHQPLHCVRTTLFFK